MEVAIVHDYLTRLGGAERVTKTLMEIFPKAPVYTLLYDKNKVGEVFPVERVRASNLQNLPYIIKSRPKYLLPIIPRAVEEFNFSGFDLVISSSSAFTHGVITPAQTAHISYYHSPMRFAWDWTHEYLQEQRMGGIKYFAISAILKKIRMWDQVASGRPDIAIANSQNVAQRIKKYYRRDSIVIYPPVDVERFKISREREDFFLIISTLTRYKRIDLAIELFNRIKKRLVIIGEGPDRKTLESISGNTIEFKGFLSDEETAKYLRACRGLIFPGEDDFGITPVEAMACGKPVLAYGAGGAKETIIAGVTGEFFMEPVIASMEDGLGRLIRNESQYKPSKCRAQAEKFSKEIFMYNMKTAFKNAKKMV